MPTILFYAVDLADLTSWIGRSDPRALEAVRATLREDEDADWEPEELQLLDRLLSRMVMEGILYRGLDAEERYYLTQLLIDLFDEFVDSEAVSDDWTLTAVEEALAPARRDAFASSLADFLLLGRTLGGEETLWRRGEDLENLLPYLGYVTRAELPALEAALRIGPPERRVPAARRAIATACRACIESERDLVALVSEGGPF